MKIIIYLCDFEYFNSYTSSRLSIPLNVGYIASYTQQLYGKECEIVIFKNANKLIERAKHAPPHILGMSCYLWNLNLDIFVAEQVKKINPECIIVVGGWNIDSDSNIQLELYKRFYGNANILIANEGEIGFANVVGKYLSSTNKNIYEDPIDGCTFFRRREIPVRGKDVGLSLPLEKLPSPILSGLLDEFLGSEFLPVIQTSRMCPYACVFCCAGREKGKLRYFPVQVVKDEIEYIADRYAQNIHAHLFITDENFGMLDRDLEIAQHMLKVSRERGYPKQVFVYFSKKFTPRVKKIINLIGDMNAMGVTLPLQSLNKETICAVNRKNLSEKEIDELIAWARSKNLDIFTELIFGLPYETKKSFLDGIEHLISKKINLVLINNLILLMGSVLNRKSERKRFDLVTKYRPASDCNYDEINGKFICEVDEVVVSSNHFNFEDYLDIRKISLLFWTTFNAGYFNRLMSFLIEKRIAIVPLFENIMTPSRGYIHNESCKRYVNDFAAAASFELFDTENDVIEHMREIFERNNRQVGSPTRLNPWYGSRLIYQEKWFGPLVSNILFADEKLHEHKRILEDMIAISENEWINFTELEKEKTLVVCEDTVDYLKIKKPVSGAGEYILKLSSSQKQKEIIRSFLKKCSINDPSVYFNSLVWIQPRKTLRHEILTVQEFR
jgi:radical SAM superfamily enzyme YgiQ (UPF0313 family)